MSILQTCLQTRGLFCLLLVCLLFAAPLQGQAQTKGEYDPWQERKEVREGIEILDGIIHKLETGEYVAVKLGDRLVSVPKETVIKELTLQLLAGEITSAEMTAMSRLLGIWSKQRIASHKKSRQLLSERLAQLEAQLGTDVSGRTKPPGKPGGQGTIVTPPPPRPGRPQGPPIPSVNWAGVYKSSTGTITIQSAGNSISATYQYKSDDAIGKGEWTNCQVTGNQAKCNWTEDYRDMDKTTEQGGTLEVTLNGDKLVGVSTLGWTPEFNWLRPERKGTYPTRKAGATYKIDATRIK